MQPQPARVLHKADIAAEAGHLAFCATLDAAVELALEIRSNAAASTATPVVG